MIFGIEYLLIIIIYIYTFLLKISNSVNYNKKYVIPFKNQCYLIIFIFDIHLQKN